MTEREFNRLIYLTGSRASGYRVVTSAFEGCQDLVVPNVGVGNAVVRALRQHAKDMMRTHPVDHLFPPSMIRRAIRGEYDDLERG